MSELTSLGHVFVVTKGNAIIGGVDPEATPVLPFLRVIEV